MDAQDLQIIRHLNFRPYEAIDDRRKLTGPWDIARGIGIHGTTVKRRVEQMQRDGVLQGLHMLPHFSLLGLRDGLYLFTFPDEDAKRRGFARMREHQRPGGPYFTARIDAFLGNQAKCAITCPASSDIDKTVGAAAAEFGAVSWELLETRDWKLQPGEVSEIDRRVLGAFYTDALKPISQVAHEAGVTAKTVRSRINKMVLARRLEIFPDVAPARVRGLVPHLIVAEPKPAKTEEAGGEMAHAFPDAFIRSRPHAKKPFACIAAADTAQLAKNLGLARSLPSVKDARLLLFEESVACANHQGTPPLGPFLERSARKSVSVPAA